MLSIYYVNTNWQWFTPCSNVEVRHSISLSLPPPPPRPHDTFFSVLSHITNVSSFFKLNLIFIGTKYEKPWFKFPFFFIHLNFFYFHAAYTLSQCCCFYLFYIYIFLLLHYPQRVREKQEVYILVTANWKEWFYICVTCIITFPYEFYALKLLLYFYFPSTRLCSFFVCYCCFSYLLKLKVMQWCYEKSRKRQNINKEKKK